MDAVTRVVHVPRFPDGSVAVNTTSTPAFATSIVDHGGVCVTVTCGCDGGASIIEASDTLNPGSENTRPSGPAGMAACAGHLSTGATVSATTIVTSPLPMLSARSVAVKCCCEVGNG